MDAELVLEMQSWSCRSSSHRRQVAEVVVGSRGQVAAAVVSGEDDVAI